MPFLKRLFETALLRSRKEKSTMRLEDWIRKNDEPYSIVVPPMTARVAKDILVEEVLGKDWSISYPCNGEQAMAEIVAAVVKEVKRLRAPWWKKLFA